MTSIARHEESFGEILSRLIKEYNISISEFCKAVNLSRITIYRLMNDKTKAPSANSLAAIAKFFNISVDQLLGNATIIYSSDISNKIISDFVAKVPLITKDNLVNFKLGKKVEYHGTVVFNCPKPISSLNNLVAIMVDTDAMYPIIDNSSIIVIDLELAPSAKDYVVAYIKENNEFIVRQLYLDGTTQVLVPQSKVFNSKILSKNDFIVGKVIHNQKSLL